VATYRYDPFGNTISSSGSLASANVYRFSSKEIHVASGMYYYGYRFYDPNLQRWLNRDPIQELGGINLYEFVLNSPTGFLDIYGLQFVPPVLIEVPPIVARPVLPPEIIQPRPLPVPFPEPLPRPAPIPVPTPRPTPPLPALLPISGPNPSPKIQPPAPKKPECDPKSGDVKCFWTGKTIEKMPGVSECEYTCTDGSTVYKLLGPTGCKARVNKNDPYITPGSYLIH